MLILCRCFIGNCNSNFVDSAIPARNCTDYADLNLCTSTGDYGEGWNHNWGTFEDYANKRETAIVCPQCGCNGK